MRVAAIEGSGPSGPRLVLAVPVSSLLTVVALVADVAVAALRPQPA